MFEKQVSAHIYEQTLRVRSEPPTQKVFSLFKAHRRGHLRPKKCERQRIKKVIFLSRFEITNAQQNCSFMHEQHKQFAVT